MRSCHFCPPGSELILTTSAGLENTPVFKQKFRLKTQAN